METDKKYRIGPNAETALNSGVYFDSYIEAEKEKDRIEDVTGMKPNVYRVVTTVSVADRVSEDYWEYRYGKFDARLGSVR